VTKPFSPQRLLARIRNLLRSADAPALDIATYAFGRIDVDFRKHEVTKNRKIVDLSAKEFDILKYFILHESEVISREMLLNDVWGYESFPTTRTVDNYILSIRKKLEDDASRPAHFLTIHTVGYKFLKNP
jgi:DNA-binding response OmpR family regulator